MIHVARNIVISESELHERFVRASGPGGQNVNKLATAVQLRFDVRHSPSLPRDVRERLLRLGGRRVTSDGVLIITAQRLRTQEQNRRDAMDRLMELLRRAAERPKRRRRTSPSLSSKRRRLEGKRRRSTVKRIRGRSHDSDDDA